MLGTKDQEERCVSKTKNTPPEGESYRMSKEMHFKFMEGMHFECSLLLPHLSCEQKAKCEQ